MKSSFGLMRCCKYCGNDFRSSSKRRVYCSDDCFENAQKDKRRKYSRENKEEIYKRRTICKYCGNKFNMKKLKERCCGGDDCIIKKQKEQKSKYYNKNIKKSAQRNKEKDAENSRNYRRTHSEEINKRKRSRMKEKREWLDSLKKESKCSKCGEERWFCLEYHHIDPSKKKFGIAVSVSIGYGKKRILEEIKKCIVLCANCHKELHYKEYLENREKKEEEIKNKYKHYNKQVNKEIEENKKNEDEINNLFYKKINYYPIIEKELGEEWVQDLRDKAKNNSRLFKGNQFKKEDGRVKEKINISATMAEKTGTSKYTVSKIFQIYYRGTEEQKQRARTGESSIEKIYKELIV